jgi:hypothetical protein
VGFQRQLKQQALFGTPPIFDTAQGTEVSIEGHAVTLQQDTGRLTLSEEGSFLLVLPLPPPEGLSAIIEEDVIQALVTGFQFAAQVLQTIDPTERLSSLAVAVALLNSSHSGWRTRAEHDRSPNRMTMSRMFDDTPVRVSLSPPHRSRAAFRQQAQSLAEDFRVLLRRAFKD